MEKIENMIAHARRRTVSAALRDAGEHEVGRLRGYYEVTAWDRMVIATRMSQAEIREDTLARSERRGRAAAIVCRERVRRVLGWAPIPPVVS